MRVLIVLALVFGFCVTLGVGIPSRALGQDVEVLGVRHGKRPPPAYYEELARNPLAFQFQHAWFRRARAVFAERGRLRRAADVDALNAAFRGGQASRAAASGAGVAVTGTVAVPVLLGGFMNIVASAFDSAAYQGKLFSAAPAPPYSVTSYYDEVSRSLLTVAGQTVGWFATDSADTYYEGTGQCLNTATSRCGQYLRELFIHFDPILDFGAFDNDGPDGMPNSGDDDGIVDVVAVIFPEIGGNCSTNSTNVWPHRFVYRAWPASGGAPFPTGDAAAGGGVIRIDDYIIQGGVGGSTGCGPTTSIMPIGVLTHELGHAFGLPDLYDTSVGNYGVGHWDLMASGGADAESPSHMSSWSLDQLGWITVDTILGTTGFRSFNITPIQASDTVFALCTAAVPANCFAEEYFYLENRERRGSDLTSLPGRGLLIFHVDPVRIGDCAVPGSRCFLNTVNHEPDPGYDLEEADGRANLNNYVNLGDADDPYPGPAGTRTRFDASTTPNSDFNDGTPTNITVDSIAQDPDSSVHVAVGYNTVTELIQTNIAGTSVIVDGSTFPSPHSTPWVIGSSHTIAVDSIQSTAPGTRHVFQSWSDAGTRSHTVVAAATPQTFTATLNTEHRLTATVTGMGTIVSSMPLDMAGQVWVSEGLDNTLTAAADPSYIFFGWAGDTTTTGNPLVLTMNQPYTVQAQFTLPVAVTTDSLLPAGVMGADYADTLVASGGSGSYVWTIVGGVLPTGVTLDSPTGIISGVAAENGDFAFTARATSGPLTAEKAFGLSVTKPSLSLANVVDQLLLTGVSRLSSDEIRFLDLLGNSNGRYDVGDLREWLIDTGSLSPAIVGRKNELNQLRSTKVKPSETRPNDKAPTKVNGSDKGDRS